MHFPVKDSPEGLRSELEAWVRRIGCQLVIIIDDIDRLQVDEMLAVMKLVRLSAKLQNTVFLLSLDHLVVIETLKNSRRLEPEFLDKIIQQPVPLPPAEQRDIDRFLLFSDSEAVGSHRSAIDRIFDELRVESGRRKEFDEKIGYFYQTVVRRMFRTMRHAKRYLNTLRATLPPIVDEVNLYDFVLLEVLQVFFPKIYRDIWTNAWFYLPAWYQDVILVYPFALVSSREQKYRLIREHIDTLCANEPQREVVREILGELFFVEVKNALKQHSATSHDGAAESYLAEKRLTHPKCFPRYFLFRIPTGEIADAVVKKLIDSWNAGLESERTVLKDLSQYQEAGQLIPLLEKLHVFRQLISPQSVPNVSRAIGSVAPTLSRGDSPLSISESQQAVGFLLAIIEERASTEDIEPLVEALVRGIDSFPFLVSFVYSCVSDSSSYRRIKQTVNTVTLQKLASDRLAKHFIEEKRDIFEEVGGRDLALVLYYWATDWRTDSPESRLTVQGYLLALIDRKPQYLGRLLWEFRTGSVSSTGEHFQFDYEGFKRAFDVAIMADRLTRYGEAPITNAEAKEAARLFREQYDAEKREQANPKKK